MKKILLPLLLILFSASLLCSQTPQAIPYQAVARDSFGTPLPNQSIQLRMSIRSDSAAGAIVYQETTSAVTNALGLFTVHIGTGTVVSGTFSAIHWANGSKYLQVEVDPNGGSSYVNLGASPLLSVPYALFAGKSNDIASVAASRIPYGNGTGLISDANFTRDTVNGNTLIKTLKDGSFYALSLGDSTFLDVGVGTLLNIPSVALSYGDTAGSFAMNIGVGKVPGYDLTQFGFMNLSKTDGTFAGINFLEYEGQPMIMAGANHGGMQTPGGSTLSLTINQASLGFSVGENKRHGIAADSLSLKIYSSDTDYYWTWPNTEGTNGQALITDGSGNLSWTSAGYALQAASASFNPSDTTTYYFGQRYGAPPGTAQSYGLRIPRSGTIKAAYFKGYVDGTFAGSESVSVYIRHNNTDYAISTSLALNDWAKSFEATALSISVNAGDEIIMKVVCPVWATNPVNVSFTGTVYIE